MASPGSFPLQLNTRMIETDVDQIPIKGDGWCLYASYLMAFRVYKSPIGMFETPTAVECWRLACTVSTLLEDYINTPDGEHLRQVLQGILDAEVMKDVRGNRITNPVEYLHRLRTLKTPGVPAEGPMLWPDISMIGAGFTKAIPSVGWALYEADKRENAAGVLVPTGKYNLNTAIFSETIQDNAPSTDLSKPFLLLMHTGSDHYELLRPKEGRPIRNLCLPPGASLTWNDAWYQCDGNGLPYHIGNAGATVAGPTVTGPTVAGPTVTGPTVTGPTVTGPTVTGPTVAGSNTVKAPPPAPTIPTWASSFLQPSNVDPKCAPHGIFQTPDCVTRNLADHLATVDKFAQSYRVSKQMVGSDPKRAAYDADYAAWMAEPDPQKKKSLKKKMDAKYYDVDILVHAPSGETRPYKVVNPYRAMASRETVGVSFANPGGKFPAGTDEAILKLNAEVLQAIAPPELIANTPYAISLLESLWFCGTNPAISTDPRCYPAQVLGELREYTTFKDQVRDSTAAGKLLASDSQGVVRKFVDFLKGKGVTRMAEAPPAPVPPPPPAPVLPSPSPASPGTIRVPEKEKEKGANEGLNTPLPLPSPSPSQTQSPSPLPNAGRSPSVGDATPAGVPVIVPMLLGKPKDIRDAFVIPSPLAGGRRRVFPIRPRNK